MASYGLAPAQEAAHVQRRAEIWRVINSKDEVDETARKSHSLGGRGNKDFASEVATLVGAGRNPESVKRDVQLKIARARELGPDITRIAGTSLDKGVEMDALIKLPSANIFCGTMLFISLGHLRSAWCRPERRIPGSLSFFSAVAGQGPKHPSMSRIA